MRSLEQLPPLSGLPLLNIFEYGFRPRRFALRHAEKLGRTYRLSRAGTTTVFTSEPEHVRRLFSADSDTLGTFSAVSLGRLLGERSVLITSGPLHKKQRKLLSPPVTGARLRSFGTIMQELAQRRVASLRSGDYFRALDLTTEYTLDVIVRTVFGLEAHELDGELKPLLRSLAHDVPRTALFAPSLQHRLYPPFGRYLDSLRRFDHWVRRKIAERRAREQPGEDVLSLLLGARYEDGTPLEDVEIRDQLLTMLLAGHETTSVALATCLDRVHHDPAVLERLRAEVANVHSPEEVQRLPYLSAVIDETLRIDPVVTDVSRVHKVDFALDAELTVKRGNLILVLIEALHNDPEIYPEPERFRPERFLERKFAPHEFAPFGGGVRRCLGAAFSDYETKVMLATLLRETELRAISSRPDRRVRRNVTMGPSHGVGMKVVRRLAS